jgi:hypothetical protein
MDNILDQMGLKKDEMNIFDDNTPEHEKVDKYFKLGLFVIALKKFLLFLFSMALLKKFVFVLIPLKFLIFMKALGLANAALLGMLFLRQALTPAMTINPLALG